MGVECVMLLTESPLSHKNGGLFSRPLKNVYQRTIKTKERHLKK